MFDLTPEQRAKLIAGWKWQKNQIGLWVREESPDAEPVRVRYIRPCFGGIRAEVVDDDGKMWRPLPRELTPDLSDPVTRDGLLRTARAMWQDPQLCVYPPSSRKSRASVWTAYVERVVDGDSVELTASGDTEEEALLAAILAAPGAT